MMDRRRSTEKRSSKKNKAAAITAPHVVPPEMAVSTSPTATLPDATKPLSEQEPVILLAMCLFGEARGEGRQTQQGVAQTVINRAKHPHPVFGSRRELDFAENLRRVILQPRQFSSFNAEDPNYGKLLRPLEYEEPAAWEQCLRCAQEALAAKDREDTLTANSDHYFDDSIQPPTWADPAKQTVQIGRLNFYRLYLRPPKDSMAATSPIPWRRGAGSVVVEAPLEPSPAARPTPGRPSGPGSLPNTSLPAAAHATVRAIGCSQHRWVIRGGRLASLALVALSLALTACNDLERTAYRTLATTQAEYETLQQHMVEAALQGLLTEEQWDRFVVAGHHFIQAHNAAVDAFAFWSQTKNKNNVARLEAMLEMLPRLIREINSLVESFEKEPEVRSQESEVRRETPYSILSPDF